MGKRNQLYGRWLRLLPSPDNPCELYLIIRKDSPMETKYIRQFENMFQGKDVILTIGELVRNQESQDEHLELTEEVSHTSEIDKKRKKEDEEQEEDEELKDNPMWSVQT